MNNQCCDNCTYYQWYYDWCEKWHCEVDFRSKCNSYTNEKEEED